MKHFSSNHTPFQFCISAFLVDPASGTTCDYAYKGGAGVKYSYTPELRGPGHDPPKEEIEPGWRELWAGFNALVAEIEKIEYS